MTLAVTRQVTDMSAEPFDPLVDLDGLWTVDLAERYLPLPGVPAAKYECWDGRLYMAPYEAAQNSYGAIELATLLKPGARKAGYHVYGTVNLLLGQPNRWVQPDLTILTVPVNRTFVKHVEGLMPVEFVSPSSRRHDRLDKPALYASAGIPWHMTVELESKKGLAVVMLYRLSGDEYSLEGSGLGGQVFMMREPFEASFDPVHLLNL